MHRCRGRLQGDRLFLVFHTVSSRYDAYIAVSRPSIHNLDYALSLRRDGYGDWGLQHVSLLDYAMEFCDDALPVIQYLIRNTNPHIPMYHLLNTMQEPCLFAVLWYSLLSRGFSLAPVSVIGHYIMCGYSAAVLPIILSTQDIGTESVIYLLAPYRDGMFVAGETVGLLYSFSNGRAQKRALGHRVCCLP